MPSDSEAALRWLRDIQHNIALAEGFTQNLSAEQFACDTLRQYAVVRCLEIISEASRRIPADIKAQYPLIPWRDIAAAGNTYRHEYEELSPNVIWRTVRRALPELQRTIEREILRLTANR
jgi:uncharacterized protein with HEPN domain